MTLTFQPLKSIRNVFSKVASVSQLTIDHPHDHDAAGKWLLHGSVSLLSLHLHQPVCLRRQVRAGQTRPVASASVQESRRAAERKRRDDPVGHNARRDGTRMTNTITVRRVAR